ncbi:MAG: ISAzo13 family transposase [Desulfobacterales bacterium]
MTVIAQIMKYETAGDPVSGCKWTRKTTGKIARELNRRGIRVSANTVGRLLKTMDYSLRRNLKSLESGLKNPPLPHQRNQQFCYIRAQIKDYALHGLPVISIDTKSREQIGPFHQPGRAWYQQPVAVLDHDFPSDAKGVAIPYGIYDFCRNEGFVNLGTSRDTAEFAVASIRIWWQKIGSFKYPGADNLLILADCDRKQRLSYPALETSTSSRFFRSLQAVCQGVPLSSRGLKMEPDRAPHVFLYQQ